MDYKTIHNQYLEFKESSLSGRYITLSMLEPLLNKARPTSLQLTLLGHSVKGLPIHCIKLGNGPKRVVAWSQMHGNESTTTKAIFDLLNFFDSNKDAQELLNKITVCIIPMLNPDGAQLYTRTNANQVDLNRDAQDLSQPESLILRSLYLDFKPDYCLNLHGQRTIFGVGKSPRSATISFLSPAQDEARKLTAPRIKGMSVIAAVSEVLQLFIPSSVGRYDDGFNLNCVGDTLQSLNMPTILFEAGHIDGDYEREEVRKLIFISLLKTLEVIANDQQIKDLSKKYFKIPENRKCFFDHVVRNIVLPELGKTDIAVQYKEVLENGKINFVPFIEKIGNLSNFNGHNEVNCNGANAIQNSSSMWNIGEHVEKINMSNGKTITFSLNLPKTL